MSLTDTESAPFPGNHLAGLDALRLLLCAGVVFYHYIYPRPSSGPLAVIGFFVLSGYLCARSLRNNSFDNLRFFRSKARRLLPTLLSSTLFAAAVLAFRTATTPDASFTALWKQWTLAHYSLHGFIEIVNIPAWYMQGEILCLALTPLLWAAMSRKTSAICLFLLLFSTALVRFLQIPWAAPFGEGLYFDPLCRVWQFMAGMLCARFGCGTFPGLIRAILLILYAGLYAASLVLPQDAGLHFINYTLPFDVCVTILYVLLIPVLAEMHPTRFSSSGRAILAYAASLTYGVYLFHVPVFLLLRHIHPNGRLIPFESDFLSVAAVIFIAAVNKKWCEKR